MANNEKFTPRRRGPMGPGMGGGPAEKTKDFKGATKRLFKELKDFRILIYIALILAILGAILSISAPNRLSKLTDKISEGLVLNSENLKTISSNIVSELPSSENTENETSSEIDFSILENMTEEQKSMIFPEFEIDGVTISSDDQIEYMKIISTIDQNGSKSNIYSKIDEMPESIKSVIEPKMDIEAIKNIAILLANMGCDSFAFDCTENMLLKAKKDFYKNNLIHLQQLQQQL